MELKLNRKEIEAILLAHVNRLIPAAMPVATFNRVEWDSRYSGMNGATFDHTDLPPEDAA